MTNQFPNRKPIKQGSQAYIVMCYAKTKKGWFTRADYRSFQLNRKDHVSHVEESFKHLAKTNCLEQETKKGQERYRITLYGQHVLQLMGQARKKAEYDHLAANGAKSCYVRQSRVSVKLNQNAATL
jgi:hypothetical protein